jgi:hypothetical protein
LADDLREGDEKKVLPRVRRFDSNYSSAVARAGFDEFPPRNRENPFGSPAKRVFLFFGPNAVRFASV